MKKLNRKIIGRVCVGIVLLALVLWLMPLPLPFHISLSGVRVEDSTAAEPAALEAKGWRLCRFLRRTELRASFTVETAQGTKIYEPVDCLWELTFPDGPIRMRTAAGMIPRQTQLRRCALCTVPTARPPFSKSWTMGRISSSCSLQTGVSRRKRWISCA